MNILWISEIPWGLLKQRHHHLIENFPKEWNILFAEPVVLKKFTPILPKKESNVTRFAVPILTGRAARKHLHEWFLAPLSRLYIRLMLKLLRMDRDLVIICSNVYAAPFLADLNAVLVCYDCNDNHKAFPNTPGWVARYIDQFYDIAEVIFTPSKTLYDFLKRDGKNVYRIGNGCDSGFMKDGAQCPADMAFIPHPVIGYVGVISEWLDFDLLESILDTLPEASLVLIGPSEDYSGTKKGLSKLLARKRVYALGKKEYKDLPDYIRCFDVGIIPFLKTDLTRTVNPNKLYEYAAVGIPVVTTDFSDDLLEYADKIIVALSREHFIEALRRLVSKEQSYDIEAARDIALSNTWKVKAEEMIEIINKECARKKYERFTVR